MIIKFELDDRQWSEFYDRLGATKGVKLIENENLGWVIEIMVEGPKQKLQTLTAGMVDWKAVRHVG